MARAVTEHKFVTRKSEARRLNPKRKPVSPKTVTANFIKRGVRDQNDGKKQGLSCTRMKGAKLRRGGTHGRYEGLLVGVRVVRKKSV